MRQMHCVESEEDQLAQVMVAANAELTDIGDHVYHNIAHRYRVSVKVSVHWSAKHAPQEPQESQYFRGVRSLTSIGSAA